jgi:hypothetical protein
MPMGPGPTPFNVARYEEELMASSKKTLEEVLNHLETKEVKARLTAVRGDAADEIVRTAHEENVDLIVIATRGRTGLDRLIFGSVAEKVIRLAKCPVLTISGRPSSEKGEEVKIPEEKSEKKKAYQETIEAQLKEWGVRIDELKVKAERSKVELKVKYRKQVEDLRFQKEALEKKLQEFKESGEETWEHFKTGIEKGFGELKDSVDRTISLFKEKGEEVAGTVSKKKETYVEKIEDQLKEWGTEIDLLKAKAEKAKAEAKIIYVKQVEDLRAKEESVKQKVNEIRESGDEAWEDFTKGVEDALKDMKKALKQAASRFKKS